jgi:sortase A
MRKATTIAILGRVLIVGGALVLGWYGYIRFDMFRMQHDAARVVEPPPHPALAASHSLALPSVLVNAPPRPGDPLGRIEIPRIRLSAPVAEGDTPKILRAAAGHIHGTALPGMQGNVVLAAHRDTYFRPLKDVRANDDVILRASYGTFHYRVSFCEIVGAREIRVLRRTADPELTLITCYPFSYVGPAPKRFVVHATLQM